jgi:hypothetical protein
MPSTESWFYFVGFLCVEILGNVVNAVDVILRRFSILLQSSRGEVSILISVRSQSG